MQLEAARSALVAAVDAVVSALDPVPAIQAQNRFTVDLATQVDPFVCVDLVVYDAVQMNFGDTKIVRYFGTLALLVKVRQGEGASSGFTLVDALCAGLQIRSIDGVTVQAAKPQKPLLIDGWETFPVAIPLWFDDTR